MLTAQTHGAALVAAKLTAKAVRTRILFVSAFTHFTYTFYLSEKYFVRISPLVLLSQPLQLQNTSPR